MTLLLVLAAVAAGVSDVLAVLRTLLFCKFEFEDDLLIRDLMSFVLVLLVWIALADNGAPLLALFA